MTITSPTLHPPVVASGTTAPRTTAPRTVASPAGLALTGAALTGTALTDTARALVAGDKALLAIDESIPTCHRRFARRGIPQTEQARRAYRELIITTPGLGASIRGVILYDETIRQDTAGGVAFLRVLREAGIAAGIKVDRVAEPMAGHPEEKVTEGLDGLRARLEQGSC